MRDMRGLYDNAEVAVHGLLGADESAGLLVALARRERRRARVHRHASAGRCVAVEVGSDDVTAGAVFAPDGVDPPPALGVLGTAPDVGPALRDVILNLEQGKQQHNNNNNNNNPATRLGVTASPETAPISNEANVYQNAGAMRAHGRL